MTNHFKDNEYMVPADGDSAGRGLRGRELKPVAGKPEFADIAAEYLESRAAAAERGARTAFGMVDYPGFHTANARAAYDRRCYFVGAAAIGFCLAVALGALLLAVPKPLGYGWRPHPGWLGAAAPHIADNDPAWCSGFSGLSCTKDKGAH